MHILIAEELGVKGEDGVFFGHLATDHRCGRDGQSAVENSTSPASKGPPVQVSASGSAMVNPPAPSAGLNS